MGGHNNIRTLKQYRFSNIVLKAPVTIRSTHGLNMQSLLQNKKMSVII